MTSLIHIQQPNNYGPLNEHHSGWISLQSSLFCEIVPFFVLNCTLPNINAEKMRQMTWAYPHQSQWNPQYVISYWCISRTVYGHNTPVLIPLMRECFAHGFFSQCTFVKYFEMSITVWPRVCVSQTFLHTNFRACCSSLRSEGRTYSRNKT